MRVECGGVYGGGEAAEAGTPQCGLVSRARWIGGSRVSRTAAGTGKNGRGAGDCRVDRTASGNCDGDVGAADERCAGAREAAGDCEECEPVRGDGRSAVLR